MQFLPGQAVSPPSLPLWASIPLEEPKKKTRRNRNKKPVQRHYNDEFRDNTGVFKLDKYVNDPKAIQPIPKALRGPYGSEYRSPSSGSSLSRPSSTQPIEYPVTSGLLPTSASSAAIVSPSKSSTSRVSTSSSASPSAYSSLFTERTLNSASPITDPAASHYASQSPASSAISTLPIATSLPPERSSIIRTSPDATVGTAPMSPPAKTKAPPKQRTKRKQKDKLGSSRNQAVAAQPSDPRPSYDYNWSGGQDATGPNASGFTPHAGDCTGAIAHNMTPPPDLYTPSPPPPPFTPMRTSRRDEGQGMFMIPTQACY
jgi:hypothetical protein